TSASKLLAQCGHTYVRMEDYNSAVATFGEVVAKYPKTKYAGDAAYYKAFLYDAMYHYSDSAIKYYEFFIKNYPDNELVPDTKVNLDWLKELNRRKQEQKDSVAIQ